MLQLGSSPHSHCVNVYQVLRDVCGTQSVQRGRSRLHAERLQRAVFGRLLPLPIHGVSAGISKSLSFTYVGENV